MTRETYRTNIQKSNHIIRPLELLKNIMKNRVEIITKLELFTYKKKKKNEKEKKKGKKRFLRDSRIPFKGEDKMKISRNRIFLAALYQGR